MKIRFVFILLFTLLFTTSCKYHYGLTHNENHHQTQVVLDESNYRVVKYVEGDAYARYFLGIGGGASKRGIIARARENMLQKAGLIGKSRAVINETVELRVKNSLFITEVRYIVSGYIVEFFNPALDTPPVAEENIYAVPDRPRAPNIKTRGIQAGYAHSYTQLYSHEYTNHPGAGFTLGVKTEYSNPDLWFLFLESQLNLVYLNWNTDYRNRRYSSENSFGLELPVMAGLRLPLPFVNSVSWYLKTGPFLNLFNVDRKVYKLNNDTYDRETGILGTAGLKLGIGFQFGKHWQTEFGHRFNIGWGEYDHTHFTVSYLF